MFGIRKAGSLGLTRFMAMGGLPAAGEGVVPFFAYPERDDARELDASTSGESDVSEWRGPRVARDLGVEPPRPGAPTNDRDACDELEKMTARGPRRARSLEPI